MDMNSFGGEFLGKWLNSIRRPLLTLWTFLVCIWMAFFIFNFVANAGQPPLSLKVTQDHGEVRFLAIGNPGGVQIMGKGPGPEGKLLMGKTVNHLTLEGELSFQLQSLDTGMDLRNQHMKEKYLEVGKFDRSSFTLQSIVLPPEMMDRDSEGSYPFKGVLQLHGVHKDVTGKALIKFKSKAKSGTDPGKEISVVAAFPVNPKEFAIEVPSFAGITVANEVNVEVEFSSSVEGQEKRL